MARHVLPRLLSAVAVALSISLSTAPAAAQVAPGPTDRPAYGVVAGINFANLGGSDVENSKVRTGFVGGVYGGWPIANGFSFQPSLLYGMEGAKATGDVDFTLKMNYLRLPAMLRYAFPTTGTTKPFFAIGPSFGYQLSCDVSGSANGVSASASCDEFSEGESQRKKFDVSGRIEGGMDFVVSGRKLTLGGAYSYGFTDVAKDGDAKSRVFSIFFGVGM